MDNVLIQDLVFLYAMHNQFSRFFRYVYAYPFTVQIVRRHASSSTAAKWVKHYVIFVCAGSDNPLKKCQRFLCWVSHLFFGMSIGGRNVGDYVICFRSLVAARYLFKRGISFCLCGHRIMLFSSKASKRA